MANAGSKPLKGLGLRPSQQSAKAEQIFAITIGVIKETTRTMFVWFFYGSECWARTSDNLINSSRLFLSIDFAGYIISDLPGNTGLCVSNGLVSRPSFSHSPKFHASFHASDKIASQNRRTNDKRKTAHMLFLRC